LKANRNKNAAPTYAWHGAFFCILRRCGTLQIISFFMTEKSRQRQLHERGKTIDKKNREVEIEMMCID